jgi:hypothetical protein
MFSDKTVYCLNSAAVGDLIASAPALKFVIDSYHTNGKFKSDYKVGIYPDFKCLFPFVPDENFADVGVNYPENFAVKYLNAIKVDNKNNGLHPLTCRMTPSRLKLTHYACINLLGRILPDFDLKYVPLPKVDISRYNVDFTKAVIIVTTYRDKQRSILPEEILKISEYVAAKGLTPVYVGKRGGISIWKTLAKCDFEYPGYGVDLRDDTSLLELASIMSVSKAVVGMDSGPLHLAFTTSVPVVCGFTTVAPEMRIPYRGLSKTYAVVPEIFCNFCESHWMLSLWDFNKCPRQMELAECITKMTAKKFIFGLEQLGIFSA